MIRWLVRAMATVPLAWLLGFLAYMLTLPGPAPSVHTDAILVLTGGSGRITRGLEALRAGDARRMLISGVDDSVRKTELASAHPGSSALFACCISLDRQAVDTRSNAREAWRWLRANHFASVRLVTTDWHMARARLDLELAADAPITIVPDAVASEASLFTYLREYNKLVLRGAAALVGI